MILNLRAVLQLRRVLPRLRRPQQQQPYRQKLDQRAWWRRLAKQVGTGFGLPNHAGKAAQGKQRAGDVFSLLRFGNAELFQRGMDDLQRRKLRLADPIQLSRQRPSPPRCQQRRATIQQPKAGPIALLARRQWRRRIALIQIGRGEADHQFVDVWIGRSQTVTRQPLDSRSVLLTILTCGGGSGVDRRFAILIVRRRRHLAGGS